VHEIEQLLHVGRRIGPKVHAGLAELGLAVGKPVTPQVACIDLVPIFGEKTRKAFIPATVFRNAVGKLKDCSGVHFRRRQPSANGNWRTIDNRGNMIVHRLHTMGRCRFSHSISTDIGLGALNIPDLTPNKTRARLDHRGARSCR
jgi:hypothetical protein